MWLRVALWLGRDRTGVSHGATRRALGLGPRSDVRAGETLDGSQQGRVIQGAVALGAQ
jgi:hypothetical protein